MSGAGSWSLTGRQYLLQNWRADVVLATDSGGSITDRIRYSAYGEPQRYSLCDLVCGGSAGTAPDSVIDANDYTAFINAFGANDPLADVNADGVVDGSDYSIFINAFFAGSDGPAGTGTLSNELDAGFRRGYAGYEFDPVLGASTASIYHVRNRVYDAENGRWNKRDPLGYVDGLGIYNYVKNAPIDKIDYSGLCQKPDYPNLCKGRAGVDFFLILLEGKNLKYQIPGKAPLPNAIPPKIGCGSIIEIPEMIPGAPCLYFEHELFHAVHQIQTCELYGENEFRRLYNDKL